MPRKPPIGHMTRVQLGKINIPIWERVIGKDGTSGMVNETEMIEIGEKCIEMISTIEEILENMVKRLVQQIWKFLQVIVLLHQNTTTPGVVEKIAMTLAGQTFH